MSTRAMVASSQPMATWAGLDVLRRGGNAIDAAIAASATLCVTEPQSTGIGGDCFILYHESSSGRLHGLNGSGRAPARATLDEYLRRGCDAVPERGILAVTVPGAIDAWQTALDRFGSMSLHDVLLPAIQLAEEGYAVSPVVADAWQTSQALLSTWEDARKNLLVDGRAPTPGSLHRQPLLAQSLRLIARQGRDAFYRGEIAEKIVKFSDRHDGLLSLDDFDRHQSTWVEPLSSDYRGYQVFEIPPNGQGITALMTLNILREADLSTMTHLGSDHVHTLSEAFRLATAERDRFVCDPEHAEIPLEELLSGDFASRQFARIDPHRAMPEPVASGLPEGRDTVYLSVVDEDRNAVSFINSTYYPWGCGMMVGDTGIVLHNRGGGFNLTPGHRNCIGSGKRPMHTIIPAMVYRGGQATLCYGVMGGQYQAMGHSYVLSNWIDFGMDLQEAVDAARFLPETGALAVEPTVPAETRTELERRGHSIVDAGYPLGGAQCIHIDHDEGVLQASSDPRKDGCALGF